MIDKEDDKMTKQMEKQRKRQIKPEYRSNIHLRIDEFLFFGCIDAHIICSQDFIGNTCYTIIIFALSNLESYHLNNTHIRIRFSSSFDIDGSLGNHHHCLFFANEILLSS